MNGHFLNALINNSEINLVGKIWSTIPEAQSWLSHLLFLLSTKPSIKEFDTAFVSTNWSKIKNNIGDSWEEFLSNLVEKTDILSPIIAGDFENSKADYYRWLLRANAGSNENFLGWLMGALEGIVEATWLESLKTNDALIALLIQLISQGDKPNLGVSYTSAIEEFGKVMNSGTEKPTYNPETFKSLLSAIGKAANRNTMKAQILRNAIEFEGVVSGTFFDYFGEILIDAKIIIRNKSDVVIRLFIPLVDTENEKGLNWMSTLFNKYPGKLKSLVDFETFEDEIATKLKSSGLATLTEEHLRNIARVLKISLQPKKEEDEEDIDDNEGSEIAG